MEREPYDYELTGRAAAALYGAAGDREAALARRRSPIHALRAPRPASSAGWAQLREPVGAPMQAPGGTPVGRGE